MRTPQHKSKILTCDCVCPKMQLFSRWPNIDFKYWLIDLFWLAVLQHLLTLYSSVLVHEQIRIFSYAGHTIIWVKSALFPIGVKCAELCCDGYRRLFNILHVVQQGTVRDGGGIKVIYCLPKQMRFYKWERRACCSAGEIYAGGVCARVCSREWVCDCKCIIEWECVC